jgi:hypothetical protein
MIRTTKIVIVTISVLVIVIMSVYFVQNFLYPNNGKTAYSTVINGLQLSVTVNETAHRQGDNIYATLMLTNVNNQNVSTAFIDQDAHFELDVYDSKNHFETATEESGGRFKTSITLTPNSNITYTMNWLTDAPYYNPPEGVYQFVGLIAKPNGQSVFRTAPLNITLTKDLTTTPTS